MCLFANCHVEDRILYIFDVDNNIHNFIFIIVFVILFKNS